MNNARNPRPELLVYKMISPGDMRKLLAQSNDSKTGGGARDLRLPWKTFRSVMHRIFTEEIKLENGKEIRRAQISYPADGGHELTTALDYWHATKSRNSEDRVAKIHSCPALSGGRLPEQDRGRVFLLFIRWVSGDVRTYYAYEDDLRAGAWSHEVSQVLLNCLEATDSKNAVRKGNLLSVQGYFDFLDGTVHCHANG